MVRRKHVKRIKVEIVEEHQIPQDIQANDDINNDQPVNHKIETEEIDIKEEPYIPEDETVANQCYICLKTFSSKGSLTRHLQKHIEDQYEPEICYRRNTRSGGMYIPSYYTEEKPYNCNICPKSYLTKVSLIAHKRYKHAELNHECPICQTRFLTSKKLDIHRRVHTRKNKLYKCNICNKAFTNIYILRQHITTHTGQRTFFCYKCNEEFKWKLQLKKHMRTYHSSKYNSLRRFACDICPKMFNHSDLLAVHKEKHKRQIEVNSNRNTTIRTKYNQCYICYKRFSTTIKLDEHILLHKRKKRYVCDICHKGFNKKNLLTMHIALHAKNVPLKNNICQDENVTEKPKPVYIPAVEQLYECDFCHKRFLLRTALRVHLQEHPIEITFECNICHERFVRVPRLASHRCGVFEV